MQRPGSWRRRPLPPGWERIRATVLKRDGYRCQWGEGVVCGRVANQADHINPDGPDEMWNLQALCPGHHATKSGREAGFAAGKARRAMAAARFRKPERHPGLR